MAEVRGRIVSINCRRSSLALDHVVRSRYWPNRRPHLIAALKTVAPSIIGTQECTRDQAHDITHGLGPNFTYFGGDGAGNGPVVWDGLKWDAFDAFEKEIEAPGDRWMVAVQLASRPPKLPGKIWVVSIHLTVGDTKTIQRWRHEQIRAVISEIKKYPGWEQSVICADLNSDGYNNGPLGGVRTVAAELGFRDLRTRLKNDQVERYNYSSSNGWKATLKNDRWIDDILSPVGVRPYAASLEFCCTREYPICASDHNIIRASVAWDGEVPLP
jgi:hypothetical protein